MKYTIILFFMVSGLCAEYITIHNETTQDIYVATYYVGDRINRVSPVTIIKKWQKVELARPDRMWWCDREILFCLDENKLQVEIPSEQKPYIPYKNIGDSKGSSFYIAYNNKELTGYNWVEWAIIKPVVSKTEEITHEAVVTLTDYATAIGSDIEDYVPNVIHDKYLHEPAALRSGNELCWGEKTYLEKRKRVVKRALKNLFGDLSFKEKKVPTIALLGSGGGYRAMAGMIGSLSGAQQCGLLDATTYIAALSGSTWAVGPWVTTGMPLPEFKEYIIQRMTKGLFYLEPSCADEIADVILTKYYYGQDVSIVDFYGGLIAHDLLSHFETQRNWVYLPDQQERLEDASLPFPIYTAIRADAHAPQDWWEITPFEIGGAWLGWYVPTWALGRTFDKGVSKNFATEQSMGFYLGTFGSAFAASFERIYEEVRDKIKSSVVRSILDYVIKHVGDDRLTAATVCNFTTGLDCELAHYKKLRMVDAGIDFNLPYPPVSGERPERKADILIFLDYSANIKHSGEFRKAYEYAYEHNLPFPKIDFDQTDTRSISIFIDEANPEAPIVLYMPLLHDKALIEKYKDDERYKDLIPLIKDFDPEKCTLESYCNTFNFSYPQEISRKLMALTEFNMRANQDHILQAIKVIIDRV